MLLPRRPPRRGVKAVEFALISPIVLFFIIALAVGAFGIFRYQLLASVAREGARYASVRGKKYEGVTGNPSATAEDVYNNVIRPGAIALNPDELTYSVTWEPDKRQGQYVVVRVTYRWIPERFLGGITLSSTSRVQISY